MNFFRNLLFSFVLIGLISCDNEVDLNADFVDATVVYGLIDAGADTQFVRVNKAFLKDGESAIDLAADPQNLYYDSLIVRLIDESDGQVYPLTKINRIKEPGAFSTEGNRAYYTLSPLTIGRSYRLEVQQPDGKVSSGKAVALNTVVLSKPPNVNGRKVSFVSNSGEYLDYEFQYDLTETIAKFESKLYFRYKERTGGQLIPYEVEIPLGGFTNSNLERIDDVELNLSADRFYSTIGSKVPISPTDKVVSLDSCLLVRVFAADEQFVFYQDLNGPLDGVAQVRPEYTNIENGIGLFASRSSIDYYAFINDVSRTELKTGLYTGNHNFVDP